MRLAVRPGKVVRKPLFIAEMSVLGAGYLGLAWW